MIDESAPTLKLRIAMPSNQWGYDCYNVALKIVAAANEAGICAKGDMEMVAAKWGRSWAEWSATGGDWGRKHLSERDKGYVQALRDSEPTGAVLVLLNIIDGLTS